MIRRRLAALLLPLACALACAVAGASDVAAQKKGLLMDRQLRDALRADVDVRRIAARMAANNGFDAAMTADAVSEVLAFAALSTTSQATYVGIVADRMAADRRITRQELALLSRVGNAWAGQDWRTLQRSLHDLLHQPRPSDQIILIGEIIGSMPGWGPGYPGSSFMGLGGDPFESLFQGFGPGPQFPGGDWFLNPGVTQSGISFAQHLETLARIDLTALNIPQPTTNISGEDALIGLNAAAWGVLGGIVGAAVGGSDGAKIGATAGAAVGTAVGKLNYTAGQKLGNLYRTGDLNGEQADSVQADSGTSTGTATTQSSGFFDPCGDFGPQDCIPGIGRY